MPKCGRCKKVLPKASFKKKTSNGMRMKCCRACLSKFPCEQCSVACATASALRTHVHAMHLGYRDFHCHRCDKSFKTSSAANKHMREAEYCRPSENSE